MTTNTLEFPAGAEPEDQFLERLRAAAELLDRDARFFGHRPPPPGRHHVRAAPGQRDGNRLAEPGRPADDNGDAVGEVGDVARQCGHDQFFAVTPLSSSSCDGTFGRVFVDSGSAAAR